MRCVAVPCGLFGERAGFAERCSSATRWPNVFAAMTIQAWTLISSSHSGAGAIVQPMRSPVRAFDFESPLIAIVCG